MRAAIAAFAGSIEGEVYRAVCDRYDVDPGAVFADDVEAFMMRQALMLRSPRSPKAEVTDIYEEWANSV
jgi:hypothetical protein